MRRHATAAGLVLIVLATLLAYTPVFQAGYIWDDDDYVTNNETLRAPGGLAAIWLEPGATPQYYPLVFTTFWIEYRLWELAPAGYHGVNVLLHALNGVLVWFLLRRLRLRGALFAGAVFALHPVHVESVAWVTELKNGLSGLFYLLAVHAYLGFRERTERRERRLRYGLALVLFACALLSKSVTASLPVALLLLLWWQQGRLRSRDILPTVPFFAVGAALSLPSLLIESSYTASQAVFFDYSLIERALIAGRALCFYAAKIVWPADLSFIYTRWSIDAGDWRQLLYPLFAVGLIALLWLRRRRIGRGPFAAAAFFAVTLSPALGFIDIYPMKFSFVADHFQYLASLGPIAVIAAGSTSLADRLFAGRRRLQSIPAASVLVVLALLTRQQAGIYRDAETLYRDVIAKNPTCVMAHNNLGGIYKAAGRRELAFEHYGRAIAIDPDQHESLLNRGRMLFGDGEDLAALADIRRAMAIDPGRAATIDALVALDDPLIDAAEPEVRAELARGMARVYLLAVTRPVSRVNLGRGIAELGRLYRLHGMVEAAERADALLVRLGLLSGS